MVSIQVLLEKAALCVLWSDDITDYIEEFTLIPGEEELSRGEVVEVLVIYLDLKFNFFIFIGG